VLDVGVVGVVGVVAIDVVGVVGVVGVSGVVGVNGVGVVGVADVGGANIVGVVGVGVTGVCRVWRTTCTRVEVRDHGFKGPAHAGSWVSGPPEHRWSRWCSCIRGCRWSLWVLVESVRGWVQWSVPREPITHMGHRRPQRHVP
jgi:hypothetical protein